MKPQERLANWLANGEFNYKEGAEIFVDLGIDQSMNGFFLNGNGNKLHRGMLYRQLANYARIKSIKPQLSAPAQKQLAGKKPTDEPKNTPVPVNIPVAKKLEPIQGLVTQRVKVDTNPSVRMEDLPSHLQVKFLECGQIANEEKTIHAELKQIKDDPSKKERRAELAKALVAKKEQSRKNWDEIDAWWANRQGKTPEQLAAEAAIEKDRRIKANLNYLRRNYNNSKHADEVKRRMDELDKDGVDYAELIRKVSGVSGAK